MMSIKVKQAENERTVASITRGNQPEGEMDVRGMSLRGIYHEGNESKEEIDVRGMSHRELVVMGISLRGIDLQWNEPEGEKVAGEETTHCEGNRSRGKPTTGEKPTSIRSSVHSVHLSLCLYLSLFLCAALNVSP